MTVRYRSRADREEEEKSKICLQPVTNVLDSIAFSVFGVPLNVPDHTCSPTTGIKIGFVFNRDQSENLFFNRELHLLVLFQ